MILSGIGLSRYRATCPIREAVLFSSDPWERMEMAYLWYLPAFLCGLFGVLAAARSLERLFVGQGLLPAQVLLSVVFLFLAYKAVRRARKGKAANAEESESA